MNKHSARTISTLTLTFKRQSAFSTTNREGLHLVLKRTLWSFVYLLKGIRVGVRFTKTEQLGSGVVYAGRVCFISNWANSQNPTLAGKDFYEQNVPRAEIANIVDLSEIIHRFLFGLDWYLAYWHSIDVHKRLYPK